MLFWFLAGIVFGLLLGMAARWLGRKIGSKKEVKP